MGLIKVVADCVVGHEPVSLRRLTFAGVFPELLTKPADIVVISSPRRRPPLVPHLLTPGCLLVAVPASLALVIRSERTNGVGEFVNLGSKGGDLGVFDWYMLYSQVLQHFYWTPWLRPFSAANGICSYLV